MRILLIVNDTAMHERLGVMSLSAVLKKEGYDVRLGVAEYIGLKKMRKLLRDYSPTIVGYSAMTGEYLGLVSLNLALKEEFHFFSIFGGPHATFFPQLINNEGIDAVCVGEGDIVLPEFCRRIEAKEDYWRTPNFIVKYRGDIFRNPLAELISNLDGLPFPDRDLMYDADPELLHLENRFFYSTRGCPYQCTYCFNSKYNELYHGLGHILRYRSVVNFIDEICQVQQRYPFNFVTIDDDTFLLKPQGWFEEFSELYKNRVGLPFSCNIRAELVTEKIIGLLQNAGLDSVWMGCECANEGVSNRILKRQINNEQLLRAAHIIKSFGVNLITQNLCGLPVSNSYQIDVQTLEFNYALKPIYAWSSILYPYPGTPVETYTREHKFLSDNIQHLETNKYCSVLHFDSPIEKRRIENLHKLFDLFVHFPFLRPWRDILCSLPLTRLYAIFYYLWSGYQMKFKIYPIHSLHKQLWSYIKVFFRLVLKR